MSIKSLEKLIEDYQSNPVIETYDKKYNARELVTVAEDILGKEKILTRRGGSILGIPSTQKIYQILDEESVRINSVRDESYKALEQAQYKLEYDEVELV